MNTIGDARTVELCRRFLDEMYAWNRRVNLTAVPQEKGWERHIEESLRLLPLLPAACSSLADLGSGGGLPGIPLAIALPGVQVALIEADSRKAGFLVHVAGTLGLRNVGVLLQRAEVMGRDSRWREHFDVVVSRAAAPPDQLCELALPMVRVGGELLALTGEAALSNAALLAALGGDPAEKAEGILRIRKTAPTPSAYPRRTASRRGGPPV